MPTRRRRRSRRRSSLSCSILSKPDWQGRRRARMLLSSSGWRHRRLPNPPSRRVGRRSEGQSRPAPLRIRERERSRKLAGFGLHDHKYLTPRATRSAVLHNSDRRVVQGSPQRKHLMARWRVWVEKYVSRKRQPDSALPAISLRPRRLLRRRRHCRICWFSESPLAQGVRRQRGCRANP